MDIFSSLQNFPLTKTGAVIVIGNFDGVHKGHQELLSRAKTMAAENKVPLGVLTFEPHPRRLFRPDEPPGRITPHALKAERLAQCGVDFLVSLKFDWDFASQTAETFIDHILVQGLAPSHVMVGEDFRFGQLRKGTPAMIEDAGIPTTTISKLMCDGGDVHASSGIRQALRHGDIDRANNILGWEWEIRGEVVKGDQRGRELGYPTANVKLDETIHPAYGIYAGYVCLESAPEVWHKAAVNIGIRPMFEIPIAQVEAHILDFDQDIYGQTLRLKLAKRLRGEAKFNSLDDLITQMEKDCTQAREVLKD